MSGGVYKPRGVSEEPEARLTRWRVYEVDFTGDPRLPPGEPSVTRHFVGFNLVTYDGRVSSPIQAYEPLTHIGRTRSGRRYELIDEPGTSLDAEHVFGVWLRANGVPDMSKVRDVSADYL